MTKIIENHNVLMKNMSVIVSYNFAKIKRISW